MEGDGAMRSIDNLREYALTVASVNATTRAVLAGYIDEIEREVEELRDRDYRNGREDAEGAVEFADRLKASATNRADVTLFGVDYTPLPVDVDGVPIHVGDVMEWPYGNGEFRVNGIGGNTLFYIDKDSGECEWTAAGDKRHHHAPTVEDVLREFGAGWYERMRGPETFDIADYVERYATRLRLAGEDA